MLEPEPPLTALPQPAAAPLDIPHKIPPEPGETIEVAPGILWLRLKLPYALNHVNVWLLEDGPGWTLIDTGLGDAETQAVWEGCLDRILGGKPITRLIVTHFHPDHIGLAGWFCERFRIPPWMSQSEWLFARMMGLEQSEATLESNRAFYRSTGLDEDHVEQVVGRGLSYLKRTTRLPPTYRRLLPGQEVPIGNRKWRILTGGGHSHDQVMLYSAADRLFISADQVLARISPNVSVWPVEPLADPLGLYLQSLKELRADLPEEAYVLASHHLPFYGLHRRLDELIEHHAQRCAEIGKACTGSWRTAAEMIPVLFHRPMDAHQTGFAIGEVLAHVNRMVLAGDLERTTGPDDIGRYRTL
jgi:glyoxylase-like metal-dependent hydrolase (beta-lactamase superfamily II)